MKNEIWEKLSILQINNTESVSIKSEKYRKFSTRSAWLKHDFFIGLKYKKEAFRN